jgi:hypothetical protein
MHWQMRDQLEAELTKTLLAAVTAIDLVRPPVLLKMCPAFCGLFRVEPQQMQRRVVQVATNAVLLDWLGTSCTRGTLAGRVQQVEENLAATQLAVLLLESKLQCLDLRCGK